MSGKFKFHYSLEPVLKTKRWERDALQADLLEVNDALAKIQRDIDKVMHDMALVSSEWNAAAGKPQDFRIGQFALITNYLGELARQRETMEKSAAEVDLERDRLIDLVAMAQRGVDAIERHREEEKAAFMKMQSSEACKIADDQWSTLKLHSAAYGN